VRPEKGTGAGQGAQNQQPDSVANPRRRMRRVTCRYHCRGGCSGHFTSLDAFDAHRREGRCQDPAQDDRFEPAIGVCKISGREESGGTIWRLSAGVARARAAFDRTEAPALRAVA
jgi:hypothetical protein